MRTYGYAFVNRGSRLTSHLGERSVRLRQGSERALMDLRDQREDCPNITSKRASSFSGPHRAGRECEGFLIVTEAWPS